MSWSLETLHEHHLALRDETLRQISQQFEDSAKAVNAALAAAEKAVGKAEIAAEKRFDATNEFRGQLADQAATFMPRREAEQRIQQLSDRLTDLTSRLDIIGGRSKGYDTMWGYVIGAGGLIIAVVTILIGVR